MSRNRADPYKFALAKKRSNNVQPAKKKQNTFKESADNYLFKKDQGDFLKSINDSLKNKEDVDKIYKNLLSGIKRLRKLRNKLKKYYVIYTGTYFTSKVPKVATVLEGRPAYYKLKEFQNKNNSIPYDRKAFVYVRKIKISIIDNVTKKKIFTAGTMNIDEDGFNNFMKNLINTSFKGTEDLFNQLKTSFSQSSGNMISSNNMLTQGASVKFNNFINQIVQNNQNHIMNANNKITSALKKLIYGGPNNIVETSNSTYFMSTEFVKDISSVNALNSFSQQELLSMIINLMLSYTIFYGKSKNPEHIEILTAIRANVLTVLFNINKAYNDNSRTLSPIGSYTNSNLVQFNSNSQNSNMVITVGSTIQHLNQSPTSSSTRVGNLSGSGLNTSNSRSSPNNSNVINNFNALQSTTSQISHPIVSSNQPIYYQAGLPNNTIITNMTTDNNSVYSTPNTTSEENLKMKENLLVSLQPGCSNNLPSSELILNNMFNPQRTNGTPVISGNPSKIAKITTSTMQSNNESMFSKLFTNIPSYSNVSTNSNVSYSDNKPSVGKKRKASTQQFIKEGSPDIPVEQKILNILNVLFIHLYGNVPGTGEQLKSLYKELLPSVANRNISYPFSTALELPIALLSLENDLDSISSDGKMIDKSSMRMNIKSPQFMADMVATINNIDSYANDDSKAYGVTVKRDLSAILKKVKNYTDSKNGGGSYSMEFELEKTEKDEDVDYEYTSNENNDNSVLKELLSVLVSVIPMDTNSMLRSKLNEMTK